MCVHINSNNFIICEFHPLKREISDFNEEIFSYGFKGMFDRIWLNFDGLLYRIRINFELTKGEFYRPL